MAHHHTTISEWTRDEHEGHYEAEIAEHKLVVSWTPNTKDKRGFFSWTAERDGKETKSEETYEEMEAAMALAEIFAKANGPAPEKSDDEESSDD